MPGLLLHSPADVLQSLVVAAGWATDPSLNQEWPIFVASEPVEPDDCITVYDTQGTDDGAALVNGERQEHYGIQVRVRASDPQEGYRTANALAIHLDSIMSYTAVTVATTNYRLTSWTRTTSIIPLGKEASTSKRSLFTFNALVTLRKL